MKEDLMVTQDGEVLSIEDVEFAYTREGRRTVGKEYPNPIPMEPPIGFVEQLPIHEQIRNMVRQEMSARAAADGLETEEEANDFAVDGEEPEAYSPWEEVFEPTDPWPPSRAVAQAETEVIQARADVDRLRAELAEAEKRARGGGGAEPTSDEPVEPAGRPEGGS